MVEGGKVHGYIGKKKKKHKYDPIYIGGPGNSGKSLCGHRVLPRQTTLTQPSFLQIGKVH
jgi:hypothetical protein